MKDINNRPIKIGDWIQGYNNRKHAGDKTKLYPTHPTRVTSLYFGDTYEFCPLTKKPIIWKLDIITEPLDWTGE
jgi:hypothetical protein